MKTNYERRFRTRLGSFCLSATTGGLWKLDLGGVTGGARQTKRGTGSNASLLKDAARAVRAYLGGERADFRRFPVDLTGCRPFEKRVLRELRKIPWGEVRSYQFLARQAGRPRSARYVGRILHRNRLPLILPCHRIILKSGGLGGFSKGVAWKRRLLKLETGDVDKVVERDRRKGRFFDKKKRGVTIQPRRAKRERGPSWKPTA